MKRTIIAVAAAALIATAALAPKPANATTVPAHSAALSTGASWTAGFIGFVAVLGIYDLIRRTSCSGDFLGLGGPGFTSKTKLTDPVLPPPQCGRVPLNRRY